MTDAYKTQTKKPDAEPVHRSRAPAHRRTGHARTRPSSARAKTAFWCRCRACHDPERLIDLLGKTAKMTFQLVDETADLSQAARGIVPIGDELLPQAIRTEQAANAARWSCSAE